MSLFLWAHRLAAPIKWIGKGEYCDFLFKRLLVVIIFKFLLTLRLPMKYNRYINNTTLYLMKICN